MRIVWYKRAYGRFLQVSVWYAENMGLQAALKFERDTLYENSLKMDAIIDKAINSKPVTLKDLDKKKKSVRKTKK